MVYIASCPLPAELAEPLEAVLCDLALSHWALVQVRSGEPFTLSGYFGSPSEATEHWGRLREDFPELPSEFTLTEMPDQDWQEAYKAFLTPWDCGGLHWIPEWQRETYRLPEGDVAVYFDAGMAFGTGNHPTTRLMARRLLDYRATLLGVDAGLPVGLTAKDRRLAAPLVVDAGCGSGILAISAAQLGFQRLLAFDRDEEAIRVTRENFPRNGLATTRAEVLEAGLEAGLEGRQADLILANIIADVLLIYREDLLRATAPGGYLALSGILAAEASALRQSFETAAASMWGQPAVMVDARVDGEWADLLLVRSAS